MSRTSLKRRKHKKLSRYEVGFRGRQDSSAFQWPAEKLLGDPETAPFSGAGGCNRSSRRETFISVVKWSWSHTSLKRKIQNIWLEVKVIHVVRPSIKVLFVWGNLLVSQRKHMETTRNHTKYNNKINIWIAMNRFCYCLSLLLVLYFGWMCLWPDGYNIKEEVAWISSQILFLRESDPKQLIKQNTRINSIEYIKYFLENAAFEKFLSIKSTSKSKWWFMVFTCMHCTVYYRANAYHHNQCFIWVLMKINSIKNRLLWL